MMQWPGRCAVRVDVVCARPAGPTAAAPPARPGLECACAARGGWFERGGAAMAGPGPGRSARGPQPCCPRGPAGVRRGRGGRPAAGRRHRKAVSSSPRP